MKCVVDTNVLFTFFWKNSIFRSILDESIECYSPEYALEEINAHSSEIMKKTSLSQKQFNKTKQDLALNVVFIPLEKYVSSFPRVKKIAHNLSEKDYKEFIKDIDFFALACTLGCPLWSNDTLFKKQSKIILFTTKEIIELFDVKG